MKISNEKKKFTGEKYFSLGEYLTHKEGGLRVSDVQSVEIRAAAIRINKENNLEQKYKPGSGIRIGSGSVPIFRESIFKLAIEEVIK
jgi:hypothetical protein